VGDVALVPEGDVLEGGLGVGADDACEPEICSLVTGLRLCGMAEEPFCFSLKNSSASRTSVRWR